MGRNLKSICSSVVHREMVEAEGPLAKEDLPVPPQDASCHLNSNQLHVNAFGF